MNAEIITAIFAVILNLRLYFTQPTVNENIINYNNYINLVTYIQND